MSEMIERVARAMYRSLDADPRFVGRADLTPEHPGWAEYCHQARAAIEAMREPTDAMIESARDYFPRVEPRDRYAVISDCWRAMIDAALGRKP